MWPPGGALVLGIFPTQKERRPDRWPCEGGEGEASFGQAPGPRTSDTATRWIPRARAAGTRRAPRLREQKGLAQDDLVGQSGILETLGLQGLDVGAG